MLYNPSRQDELEHSLITSADKIQLYFSIASLNMTQTDNSLGADNSKLDSNIKEKIFTDIVSNRQKINPLKSIKEEKANSDILFANPDIITMDPEKTKKLLEIKETHFTQEKISNFYVKNQFEQLSSFSEYLYYFSLLNRSSSLNESGAMEDIEKSLKSLNSKISENKELVDNFFKLIPILEQFSDTNLENLNIKLKFLKDIIPNIDPIIDSSDLILIKINETLQNVLKKLEKIILNLEEKLMKKLNIPKEGNSISLSNKQLKSFKSADTNTLYESDAELKRQILEVFSFVFSLSRCFKFSYGFFLLAKYIKKFNLETDFLETMDFSELRNIGENDFLCKGFSKEWERSTIQLPGNVISYEYQNLPDQKKDPNIDSFAVFQYLPKISSHCKFGNTWFFYNHINGLVKFYYKEEQNKLYYAGRNTKAFNQQKGFILPIGCGDSGLISFVPNTLLNKQDEAELEQTEQKTNKQLIQVLFSENISYNNKEFLERYTERLNEIFICIKDWLEKNLYSFDEADEMNFVYTSNKIKIPNEHFEKTKKSDITELLSKVVFYSNNNLIYCFRPVLKVKKDKKFYRIYFSENYVYSIDIFDLNLTDSKEGKKQIQHIKSCILTNNNQKYLHDSEKSIYSHIEFFLDHIPKTAIKNLFVNSGKLIMFSPQKKVFVYDLIYNNFELANDLPQVEESEEYHSYFLTKGNCIAFFRVINAMHIKYFYNDAYETKIYETSLPMNFSAHDEVMYYQFSQMESLNPDVNKVKQKELSGFLDLNLNFKNQKKNSNKKEFTNMNDDRNISSEKTEKINNLIYDNANLVKGNALLYILGNLALGATAKFDERNYIDITNILATDYFSYNDRKNIMIILELVIDQSGEVINIFEENTNENSMKEKALVLISLLNLLKLHVKNNSRLGWDFGIYFETQEKLQETFKTLFEILCKTIEKNFKIISKENPSLNSNNQIFENISFLLLEILFEALAFNFSDKNYFVNIISELLIEIKINEFNLTSNDSGINNVSDNKSNDENVSQKKLLFNNRLKLKILENIAKLFNKNSNYIIAFLINEYSGNFIMNMFKEHLDIIDKNIISKNPNCLINENVIKNNFIQLENENLKNRLFYLGLENILTQILSIIYVKYMNSVLNFGKQLFNQNIQNIIEEIFNNKKSEIEISEIKNKLTNFVLEISRNFFQTGLLLTDYINSDKKIKTKLIKNNFVLLNINNILNFINLINFESFPEFVFGNWFLLINLLKNLSNLSFESEKKNLVKENEHILLPEEKEYNKLAEEKKTVRSLFKEKPKNTVRNLNKFQKKIDFILDNFNIDDTKQKAETSLNINLGNLILNQKENENHYSTILSDLRTDLYMYFLAYLPPGYSEENKINITFFEKNKDEKKNIASFCIARGLEISNSILRNIPMNANLLIELNSLNYSESEEQNLHPILFKIRITNYKINDFFISEHIKSMNSFVNKTIKFFSFYENANLFNNLNVNEEVREVISSSIFSGGIKDCKKIVTENQKLNSINKDLETFFFCLDDENKKKMEFLNDQLFENDAFNSLKSSEGIESKAGNGLRNNIFNPTDSNESLISNLVENLKLNQISFEKLISIRDMDFSDCENKSLKESSLEKKEFYILKKLFALFDFLIEKVNREYIVKGPIIDKIILGLFFICLQQEIFLNSLKLALEAVFYDDKNFEKLTAQKLNIEDSVKLLENKNFEEIYFIWKNCCQIRKTFKAKKDLIFQQQDENYRDEKIKLDFQNSEIEFVKINCNLDPHYLEDKEILNYFERYLQKIKLIYYLKANNYRKNKSNSLNSFSLSRTHSGDIKKKIGFQKKNTLYLQNLMVKSLLGNNFEDKNGYHHKEKTKVKELANNLISTICNDNIDVDNILACLQSVNVKIKFREISLFIINDIFKTFKNSEIKANLISNFYQNFKSKGTIVNNLPNILENLSTSSPEQSEIITNLFHEYIYNILEELNSLYNKNTSININRNKQDITLENLPDYYKENNGNSIIYMVTLLNNLIWNIKGRNFQFLLDIQFFQNLFNNHKNEILKIAKTGMFLDPRTLIYNESISISSSIHCLYDVSYIGAYMTDIFTIFSNLIIKRIIKENLNKSQQQIIQGKNKSKGLGLTKSMSNLDHINNNELIIHILDIYQFLVDDLLEGTLYQKREEFYKKVNTNDIDNYLKETDEHILMYLPEDNLVAFNNLFFSQRKMWNICISLLRLIIVQDTSIDFVFKDISLFSKLTLFVLFANEKNIYLIFGVLKILVNHLNKNPDDFEYFGIKIKDLYKNYILPYKKTPSNLNTNTEDLLSIYTLHDIEKMNNYEFFFKYVLTLKLNSSKLRVNKNLLYFEKKIFNNTNNLKNLIDGSIEDRINEFLRFFLSQSEFKEIGIKLISSYALQNGTQIAKILDSNIGYMCNFSKIICNSKIDFNNSFIDKAFDSKDIENLVKKGTLIFDKSMYYLNQKASQEQNNIYKEINENTTEDCLVKVFIEDNANILGQIETNKPNLLFPYESECILNEEYLDLNSLVFADKVLIENILKYLKENLIEKNCYSLNHLQSYIRIIKFLKKLTLISNENINNLSVIKNDDLEEEELKEIEDAKRLKKIAHLEESKNIVENFFSENKNFFEHFLVYDKEKLPVNILNINKHENIFFSYTPYDIKMLSKNKSENLLNFQNPIIANAKNPLFPFGQIEKKEEEINSEFNNQTNNSKGKLIEEIKDLFLKINFNEKSIVFNISKRKDSDNVLNIQLIFKNYSYIQEEGDSKNDASNTTRRLKKSKQIEIYDKNKAMEIMKDLQSNTDILSKAKPNPKKKNNCAIFLTDEFLKELDLVDPDKMDVNEYLSKITSKDYKGLEGEEKTVNNDEKRENVENNQDSKSIGEEDIEKTLFVNISRKNSFVGSSKSLKKIEIDDEIPLSEVTKDENKENTIKEEAKENNENKENEITIKVSEEEVNTAKQPLTVQKRHQFIFEQYINNNYELNKCVFFLNDDYFDCVNKNFTCFSIDFSLLENDLREFLEKPSEYSVNFHTDGKSTDINRRYISLMHYLASDVTRFFVTKDEEIQKIKDEIKVSSELKNTKKNLNKSIVKTSEECDSIFENCMHLIGISLIKSVELLDIKITESNNFEKIYNQTEIIPFENQKELDIKNLGMHILKQHLRFLSLNYVKDYALWENKNSKETNYQKYKYLVKYLRMLFWQSSFKDNYFNMKLENKFILSQINFIVNEIITSDNSENIKILFNPLQTNFISLADSIDNEFDLVESEQYIFIYEVFKSIKANEGNYNNLNIQNNLLELNSILLKYLEKEIKNDRQARIINLLKLLNMFIDIISSLIEKVKNTVSEETKNFLSKLCLVYLDNKSLKTLMNVKSTKKTFSNKILEFTLNLLKVLFSCNEITESNDDIYKINTLNKNYLDLYESIDIIQNKFKSKILLDKIIKDSEEFQELVTKQFRMPNLRNSFCFTIRENKFKKYALKFENAKEKQKESLVVCELSIKNTEDSKEKEKEKDTETNICNKILSLSYELNNCLGDLEIYDNITSVNISTTKTNEKEIKKSLVYSDTANNIIPKNYVVIKDNDKNSIPTIYNLPNNISNLYNFREDRALVMKQGNKFSCKGFVDKNYPTFAANATMEEICKTENILKVFDSGVIVTNKNIHVFSSFQDYIETVYKINENYKRFPLGPIKNPKNICWAHVEDSGIVLLDTDGQIYSAGKYYFGTGSGNTSFEYNNHLIHNTVFGKKKCRTAYVCCDSSVYLIEEDDGKKYLYGSGYNCSSLCLETDNNSYIYTGKIISLANVPLKKLIASRSNIICISESNQLYYCGTQRDYFFSDSTRYFYIPKLWDWPEKNNFTLMDAYKSSKDTLFIKLMNNNTGEAELFMFGQAFLFHDGTEKFNWYDKEPFKVDLNKLVQNNKQKLEENLNKEGKQEESKDNNNPDNKENVPNNIISDELENKQIESANKILSILKEDQENSLNKENAKEKIAELNISQEAIDFLEEEFIISRFELHKKANQTGSDSDEAEEKNDSETNLDRSCISEKNKENENEKIAEFSSLTTELIKPSYKLKEIKVIHQNENNFRMAAILGYQQIKKNFNLKIIENKFNCIMAEQALHKDDKKIYYNVLNQKHAICVIKNKNNLLKDFVFAELKSEFVYIQLSVLETSESILISPILFKTKKDLFDKTGFNETDLIEGIENQLNLIPAYKIDFKNKNNVFENLNEYSILKNVDLEPRCFEYIKSNFNEISCILFIADNVLIEKNQLNENYFENNKLSKENLIDLDDCYNLKKHSIISIKCTDINIEKIYPYIYEKVKNQIMDNYIKNLRTKVLKEYCYSREKFGMQSNDKKGKFSEFIIDLNKKSQKFLGFFDQLKKVEFIDKVISILEESMICLVNVFDAEVEDQMTRLVLDNIYLMKSEYKEKCIIEEISKLSLTSNRKEIYVNRMSAKKFQNSRQVDKKFESTIFSQVYRELKQYSISEYLKTTNCILFRVNMKGENATDAGGPAREIFTQMFEDLMSKRLDLFIPTPNQQAASGLGRDLWTINPDANSIYHLDCFEFIGKVFAFSIISKVYCPINLPNFVWKLILNFNLQPDDLEEIDVLAYNSIVKPCLNPDNNLEGLNALFDYAKFTAALSNGEELELCEGGRNIRVSQDNYKKFIELYLEARYREVKEQANAINKGIRSILNPKILIYLSPEDLSERVAGPLTFDIELFKENTCLSGYEKSDRIIGFFWKFIENCTLEEKIQYLKFCWGRTTLPNSSVNWDQKHTINNVGLCERSLPVAHTCFFSIDLPKYPRYEILKQKLQYAINNSYIITDGYSLELDL